MLQGGLPLYFLPARASSPNADETPPLLLPQTGESLQHPSLQGEPQLDLLLIPCASSSTRVLTRSPTLRSCGQRGGEGSIAKGLG